MAGRPKIFDMETVIKKASEVFWKKGYEASSTEELLQAMGMGRGSFYLHFKDGKKELYQRSLDLFSQGAMARFIQQLSQAEDEIDFLKNFFLSMADKKDEQKQKGCYLGNCIVEMSAIDNKTKDQAAVLLQKLETAFKNIIVKAQKSNRITNKTDAAILAKYLINLRNGINVSMRTENDATTWKQVIQLSLEILT